MFRATFRGQHFATVQARSILGACLHFFVRSSENRRSYAQAARVSLRCGCPSLLLDDFNSASSPLAAPPASSEGQRVLRARQAHCARPVLFLLVIGGHAPRLASRVKTARTWRMQFARVRNLSLAASHIKRPSLSKITDTEQFASPQRARRSTSSRLSGGSSALKAFAQAADAICDDPFF